MSGILVETALVETMLVAPHCAGTSRICGKIKKSNVLHYICHFTIDNSGIPEAEIFGRKRKFSALGFRFRPPKLKAEHGRNSRKDFFFQDGLAFSHFSWKRKFLCYELSDT